MCFLPAGLGLGFPSRFLLEVVPPPATLLLQHLFPAAPPTPLPPFTESQKGLG